MLKKLLYLYNDGHNPFPKLGNNKINGKGGLGYHLPNKKLIGYGIDKHYDRDRNFLFEEDDGQSDDEVRSWRSDESEYNVVGRVEYDEDRDIKQIYKKGYRYDPELKEYYVDYIPDDNYDGNEIDRLEKQHKKERNILNLEDELTIDTNVDNDKVKLDEILRKLDDVYETDKETHASIKEVLFELNALKGTTSSNIDDSINLQEIKIIMDVNNYKWMVSDITNELKIKLKNDFKIQHPTTTDKTIDGYVKNSVAGKGFEEFLCSIGSPLIYNINKDIQINNNDDNILVPESLRLYTSIDLYTLTLCIECKDYWKVSSTSKNSVILQYSKLLGFENEITNYNTNQTTQTTSKIYFNENGNIINCTMNDIDIYSENKNGREYYTYYKFNDTIASYNVSHNVKDYIASNPPNIIKGTWDFKDGSSVNYYILSSEDLQSGYFGKYKSNGVNLVDHNHNYCISPKNKYIKRFK